MGQTMHGVYDAVDDVDPDLLHHYYGTGSGSGSGSSSGSSSTSSSHSSDSEPNSSNGVGSDSDGVGSSDTDDDSNSDTDGDLMDGSGPGSAGSWRDIAQVIAAAQGRNVRHEAAGVAPSTVPPMNTGEGEVFAHALDDALLSEDYPAGFNLNDEYESSESYRTGRSSRPLVIPLPHDIWFPRIVVWCKALDLLMRIETCREYST